VTTPNIHIDQQEFVDFLESLFKAENFTVDPVSTTPNALNPFRQPDLVLRKDSRRYLVSAKHYRTRIFQADLILAAARQLSLISIPYPRSEKILAVNVAVPFHLRDELAKKYNTILLDKNELGNLTSKHPNLIPNYFATTNTPSFAFEPETVLPEYKIHEPPSVGDEPNPLNENIQTENHANANNDPTPSELPGDKLITQLATIKRGKDEWQKFEKISLDILKYLFSPALDKWKKQTKTTDNLNRYDYACRINSNNAFWGFLSSRLNTQYLIIEIKNHSNEINQGQVLTTEKYLTDKALRRVAIIISRAGASDSALKIAQGAMRESGKLILILGDNEVIEMLKAKDAGNDPSDYLYDLTDEFLLSLPR